MDVLVYMKDDDATDDENAWIYGLDKSLEDNVTWVKRLKKRVQETVWRRHNTIIYRVPYRLRMVNPNAFEPQILSLGPYHYGKSHLRVIEELKWFYLNKFLHRNPQKSLEDYLKLVAAMEEQTREAYSEAPQMDSKHWVEMMLLDSCFAIEFLLTVEESSDDVASSIPIQSAMNPNVLSDMLLLENQLPFFLLEQMFELNALCGRYKNSLAMIVLNVFVDLMPGKIQPSFLECFLEIHHILHLLYICTIPHNPDRCHGLGRRLWSFCIDPMLWKFMEKYRRKQQQSQYLEYLKRHRYTLGRSNNISLSDEPSSLQWVPTAKNLENAGIVFRKKTKNVKSFLDITFQGSTLEIPPLQICSESYSLFRNLIAFEQRHMWSARSIYLASYTHLMACIINTPADIDMLRQEGIIISAMDNDDAVARFFKRPCGNIAIRRQSYLSGVFADVQRHCIQRRNQWKASLNHNYFSSPWAIISVIVAIFLFLLTIIQTILALFNYLWPRPLSPLP